MDNCPICAWSHVDHGRLLDHATTKDIEALTASAAKRQEIAHIISTDKRLTKHTIKELADAAESHADAFDSYVNVLRRRHAEALKDQP